MNVKRSAFTIVEVLVCISIIVLLVGLLLPAVQKVREAASSIRCANQLRQLIIACHSFEIARGRLPISGNPGDSWMVQILPYIEQDSLASRYVHFAPSEPSITWQSKENADVVAVPLEIAYCPNNSFYTETIPAFFGNNPVKYGRADYFAVSGADTTAYTHAWSVNARDASGVFSNFQIKSPPGPRFSNATDGRSTTLAIGEGIGRPWIYVAKKVKIS